MLLVVIFKSLNNQCAIYAYKFCVCPPFDLQNYCTTVVTDNINRYIFILLFHRSFYRLLISNLVVIDINFVTFEIRKTLTTPADHSIQIVL